MAKIDINLIPENLKMTGPLVKTVRFFKTASLLGTALFFVSIFVIVAIILANNLKLNSLDKKSRALEEDVKGLSSIEASYTKAKLQSKYLAEIEKSTDARIDEYSNLITNQATGMDTIDFEVSDTKIEFQASTSSIKNIYTFFSNLMQDEKYTNVDVGNFTYKGGNYSMQIGLSF